MDENIKHQPIPAPLGSVEPHSPFTEHPASWSTTFQDDDIENLLRSIAGSYLHFNRVDYYIDFPGADPHDGQQLPKDLQGNTMARFEKAQSFGGKLL